MTRGSPATRTRTMVQYIYDTDVRDWHGGDASAMAITLFTPLFTMLAHWQLHNTNVALVMPRVAVPIGVFLTTQFLRAVPRELEEAAELDYASHFTIFRRIMLPLSVPALTTLFKEKTGKHCLAAETHSSEGKMVRLRESFICQQGVDFLSSDGKEASIDTLEGLKVAERIMAIHDGGLANTALKTYAVANVPGLFGAQKVWADIHMWVMLKDEGRTPEETQAALALVKCFNDNNFEWARTGHLSVRQSVIASQEFAALPHRNDFAASADNARAIPAVQNQRGVFYAMITEMSAMWLTGTEPADALAAMQVSVDAILRRNL